MVSISQLYHVKTAATGEFVCIRDSTILLRCVCTSWFFGWSCSFFFFFHISVFNRKKKDWNRWDLLKVSFTLFKIALRYCFKDTEQGDLYFCCQNYSAAPLFGKSVKWVECMCRQGGGGWLFFKQALGKITLSFLIRCPKDAPLWRK